MQSLTALQAGLKRCTSCSNMQKINDNTSCSRCGARVDSRRVHSIKRTWAFLFAGIAAYFPANLLPIMNTKSFVGDTSDTIISGVISLTHSGSHTVAFIVFFASIVIPLVKFIAIAGLALSLQYSWNMSDHAKHRLHTLTELIGRWSMIDVFVVAVLVALIQLGAIITVTPGMGINAFAVSVIFTMLAASSLDPRLLWDKQDEVENIASFDGIVEPHRITP